MFLSADVRVYMPLAFKPEDRGEEQRYSQNHEEIGRLAAGVTIGQLQSRLDALNAAYIERAGALKNDLINVRYNSKAVVAAGRHGAQRPQRAARCCGAASCSSC